MRWSACAARVAAIAIAIGNLSACAATTDDSAADGTDATAAGSGPATSGASGGSGAAASDEGPPLVTGSLVDLAAWTAVPADADPWASERPADAECELGFGLEFGVFEVDSQLCTFGTFVQPTLIDVAAGQTLELIVLHDALYSEEAGVSAHLAIALGDVVAWETTVPIPSEPGLVRPTFTAPADAPRAPTCTFTCTTMATTTTGSST